MAGDVEIRGGGDLNGAVLRNAATESTLRELVRALNSKDGKSGDKAFKIHESTVKNNVSALNKSSDNLKVYNNTVSNLNKNSAKLGEAFVRIGGLAVGGIMSGIATAGRTLLGFFTDSLDSFRETSQVGATFNNDLVELRRAAAASAMPLELFTQSIAKNSQILAAFGGTVTQGAQRFSTLTKELRTSDIGTRFFGMGMTMTDLNDYMAEYLDLELKRGRLQGQTDEQLLQGTQNYILEIDKLAKITGRSRREAADAMRQNQADARVSVMRRRLNGEAAASFDQTVGLMRSSLPTEAFNSLANMMAGVIAPGDQFARLLANADPELKSFMQRVGRGEVGAEEFAERMAQLRPRIQAVTDSMGPQGVALRESFAALENFGKSLENVSAANVRAAQAEQARRQPVTEALASFAQTMEKIKGDITLALIDSGVFQRVLNGLTGLANLFTDNADKIGPAITKLIGEFDQFITRFLDKVNTDGIAGAIGDFLKGLLARIFSRATPEQQARQQANTQQLGNIRQEQGEIQSRMSTLQRGPSTAASAQEIDDLQRQLETLTRQRQALMTENNQIADATRSGLFSFGWSTLTDNIGGLSLAIGGIVGSAYLFKRALISLVAPLTALTPAIPTILALGAAIGMGGYGLGQVLQGVASVIEQVARAFDMLPTSIKKFEDIDPARIREIGPALRTLTGPLVESGFAGILARLGGDGGLPTLARSLSAINQVDSGNMRNLASGLSDIKSTIGQDFANQARNVDTFAGSIRNLRTELTQLRTTLEGLAAGSGVLGTGPSALQRVTTQIAQVGGGGGAATSEMLAEQRRLNTLIADLRPVFEATRDNTKNVADSVSGRNNPMSGP